VSKEYSCNWLEDSFNSTLYKLTPRVTQKEVYENTQSTVVIEKPNISKVQQNSKARIFVNYEDIKGEKKSFDLEYDLKDSHFQIHYQEPGIKHLIFYSKLQDVLLHLLHHQFRNNNLNISFPNILDIKNGIKEIKKKDLLQLHQFYEENAGKLKLPNSIVLDEDWKKLISQFIIHYNTEFSAEIAAMKKGTSEFKKENNDWSLILSYLQFLEELIGETKFKNQSRISYLIKSFRWNLSILSESSNVPPLQIQPKVITQEEVENRKLEQKKKERSEKRKKKLEQMNQS